jgi:hypothetical protein
MNKIKYLSMSAWAWICRVIPQGAGLFTAVACAIAGTTRRKRVGNSKLIANVTPDLPGCFGSRKETGAGVD